MNESMMLQPADEAIAIVGMAGRFPGARNIDEFWRNLCEGVESVTCLTDQELLAAGVDPAMLHDDHYVKVSPILDDIELFDAAFFGLNRREAEIMDPQQRLFLEEAWTALEHAGYDPEQYPGRVGVYAGTSINTYFLFNLASHGLPQVLGLWHVLTANDKDYLSSRVSYKLNLRGPSITVQTACSTSLVAVHLACESLLNGECDMALAGGVAVRVPQKVGYLYQAGGIAAPDGHCRAFDAQAQGTIYGSGVGAVVLKRLEDALADGDTIHALIKGSAINNDGALKVGYTAPGVDGQAQVIAAAQAIAGVTADTIGYIETHGTATALGDPIEIAALSQAFRASTDRKGFCAIGSVKTNIGHLDTAAGVAGLIKTVLALKHRQIPPSLHFRSPNPKIDFAGSPFYVNTQLNAWQTADEPRRAGVSSFGVGGTNAHVVLEEAVPPPATVPAPPRQLLLLSAKSGAALETSTDNLALYLRGHPDCSLADVAYTLKVGRRAFAHRRMLVCHDREDALRALEARDAERLLSSTAVPKERRVVFLFPGQGAQEANMGLGLYEAEPVFREAVERCAELLRPHLGIDLRAALYPAGLRMEDGRSRMEDRESAILDPRSSILDQTQYAQPALFVVEYALAQLWMAWGVRPQAMIGHSVGEYVAACLAGVLSLEDALALIAARGRLVQQLPTGSMLVVPLPEQEVVPLLDEQLALAAHNAPSRCVVSGPTPAVTALQERLQERGVVCTPLRTSHAFHSPMMAPAAEALIAQLRQLALRPPQIPYLSNVTGTWMADAQATDPGYWGRHLCQPVRFAEGVGTLLADADQLLIEIGPGRTLSTLVRQHTARAPHHAVVTSLPQPHAPEAEQTALLGAVGQFWLAGGVVDWAAFTAQEQRRRLPLPTYPFERQRYWIDPQQPGVAGSNGRPRAYDGWTLPPGQEQPAELQENEARTIDSVAQPAPPAQARSRQEPILAALKDVVVELTGSDPADVDVRRTFLEMGADSLALVQVCQIIRDRFGITVPFRMLLEEVTTLVALASYLDRELPAEMFAASAPQAPESAEAAARPEDANQGISAPTPIGGGEPSSSASTALERLMQQQLQTMSQLMAQQLDVFRSSMATHELPAVPSAGKISPAPPARPAAAAPVAGEAFGPFRPVQPSPAGRLTTRQQQHLDELIARYTARTRASKELAQTYQAAFADGRTAVGFRLLWKELVYPISGARAAGSRIWDVDGNEYIDLTLGYGINLFGHSPAFVTEVLHEQLERGLDIGAQPRQAGQVAALLCELTGLERAAFFNTGTEAVMAALRLARTATGRDKIAFFSGSFHGWGDATMGRMRTINGRSQTVPIIPGVPPQMVENALVLEYGQPQSLEILRAHADELAAVLVEPVQSRRPDLQPRAFLHELRQLTERSGSALIFDEIITGFRVHPGGAQAHFGIRADLATYGKVLGGGMPIGVVAGSGAYLDAIDGGRWSYGDQSYPQARQTFLAGTFCKHPLALAAATAVLSHLKASGPGLQQRLNERTTQLADSLNAYFRQQQMPMQIASFSSIFNFVFAPELTFANLLFYHLVDRGVHIWEGRNCFLSTAHSEADIAHVIQAVQDSVAAMRAGGFLPAGPAEATNGGATSTYQAFERAAGTSSSANGQEADGADDQAASGAAPIEMPLTEAQRPFWVLTQMGEHAARAYNTSILLYLRGPLDLDAMRWAVQQIVVRHEALRTTFSAHGDHQVVHPHVSIDIPLHDLTPLDPQTREARVAEWRARQVHERFDLVAGPLLRVSIARLAEHYHLMIITTHHIVADGWSFGVLLKDLSTYYSATCQGLACQLPPPMQFREYVHWLADQQHTPAMAAAESYWLAQFADAAPILELPTDYPRPALQTCRGTRYDLPLDPALGGQLKQLSAGHGHTLFTVLLAGFQLWLHRLTGQDDIVIGIPAAGQTSVGAQDLVGYCVNVLPIRSRIANDSGLLDYLGAVKQTVAGAYDHQDYPLGRLIEKLRLPRDPGRLPFVTVFFNLDRLGFRHKLFGLGVEVVNISTDGLDFDLRVNVTDTNDELLLECDYNPDLFAAQTIRRWLEHYQTLLKAILRGPERRLADLSITTEQERQQLIMSFNDDLGD